MSHSSKVHPSFSAEDTLKAALFILGHRRTLTMRQFSEGERDPADICVRHDVDHDIVWSRVFAEWEAEHNITSTYFVLPTAPYWKGARDHVVAISRLGHEVGIHNDALVAARGNVDDALVLLRQWADEVRSWGVPVYGLADHGGAPGSNPDIWRVHNREPVEAGFLYEAYLCHRMNSNYISDNRGLMRAPLKDVEGRQTHMLQHPGHWTLP